MQDDFERLKDDAPRRMAGMKILRELFDPHRRNCKAKTGWSYNDILEDSVQKDKLVQKAYQIKKRTELRPNDLWETYQLYHGSINHFLPSVALTVLDFVKPKRVLDFCAGWGGRALACGARGIDYLGIDSNEKLFPQYAILKEKYLTANSHFINAYAESVNYDGLVYDCVLTSPPFYYKETYEFMKDYKDFDIEFTAPVIKKVWAGLSVKGWMWLNIPEKMLEKVEAMIGVCHKKIKFNYTRRIANMENSDFMFGWLKSEGITNAS